MVNPRPPKHLSAAPRAWFEQVVQEYAMEPHHLRLLVLAAEAWDRGEQARQAIEQDGITFLDRFGTPRSRPEVAIERDARLAFARLVRELDLDHMDPPTTPRPPSLHRNRR